MTDAADLELIRKTTRELARKFDLEYWRQKDQDHEYRGSSSRCSPTAVGSAR